MYTTENEIQIERQIIALNNRQIEISYRAEEEEGTQLRKKDRQIEGQLNREKEKVGKDRCIQHRTIDRQRDSYIERRWAQIDVYNIQEWVG